MEAARGGGAVLHDALHIYAQSKVPQTCLYILRGGFAKVIIQSGSSTVRKPNQTNGVLPVQQSRFMRPQIEHRYSSYSASV